MFLKCFAYMYVYGPHACIELRNQKGELGPLELELHTVGSVGCQEWNLGHQQDQQVFLATEGHLQPSLIFTFYFDRGSC